MESGVAEHVGQHKGRAEVIADIVIRGSIVASNVMRVLQNGDAGVGVQNAKGLIGDAAVGHIVKRMAPGVIQVEVQTCRKTALQAEGEAVVVRVAGREILGYRAERGIRRGGWKTRKTIGADGGRAITVQPFIRYRDVNAMHTRVIDG